MREQFSLQSGAAYVEGECRVYPASLLFLAGEYPDKQFAMTGDELRAAAEGFSGVKVNLAHAPGIMDGRLGDVRRVWTDESGEVLFGEVAIPIWLDDHLTDQERQVSCEWDRVTKMLTGLALTSTPRVSGAALMAILPEAHPDQPLRLAPPGVENAGWPLRLADSAPPLKGEDEVGLWRGAGIRNRTEAEKETFRMPTMQEIATFFGFRPSQAMQVEPEAGPAPGGEGDDEAARLREQLLSERGERIAAQAVLFADSQVAGCKALPAERDAIVKMYIIAATQDADHGVVTFADGTTQLALPALTALFEARSPHQLTLPATRLAEAQILPDDRGVDLTRGDKANGERAGQRAMSASRRKELLGYTRVAGV